MIEVEIGGQEQISERIAAGKEEGPDFFRAFSQRAVGSATGESVLGCSKTRQLRL